MGSGRVYDITFHTVVEGEMKPSLAEWELS